MTYDERICSFPSGAKYRLFSDRPVSSGPLSSFVVRRKKRGLSSEFGCAGISRRSPSMLALSLSCSAKAHTLAEDKNKRPADCVTRYYSNSPDRETLPGSETVKLLGNSGMTTECRA
jgi:hypothetical protein